MSSLLCLFFLGFGNSAVVCDSLQIQGPAHTGVRWNSLAYNGQWFIATGQHGSIMISENGEDWERHNLGTTYAVRQATWHNGRFLAVTHGGVVGHSPDGRNWSLTTVGVDEPLNGITSNGDIAVAVGYNGLIATSVDGLSWRPRYTSSKFALNAVCWNGEKFVAAGYDGYALTSSNGLSWQRHAMPVGTPNVRNLIWTGERFVAQASSALYASVDGETWTRKSVPGENVSNIIWDGLRILSPGNVLYSFDENLDTETARVLGEYHVDMVFTGSHYLVLDTYGNTQLLDSYEGPDLSEKTEPIRYRGGASGDHIDIAVGFGIAARFDDGHWEPVLIRSDDLVLHAAATNGSRFVAVGQKNGASGYALYSDDGITWTPLEIGSTGTIYSVAYGNGKWVMVGNRVVFESDDGIVWHLAQDYGQYTHQDVLWDGNRFVATAYYLFTSPDGVAWTATSSEGLGLTDLAHNGTVYVGSQRNSLYTSPDLVSWSHVDLDSDLYIIDVAWTGEAFLAVSATGLLFTSSNGYGWQQSEFLSFEPAHILTDPAGEMSILGDYGSIAEGSCRACDASAHVSGGGAIAAGEQVEVVANLTGIPPWQLVWSDGLIQDTSETRVVRQVSPMTDTIYSLTSVIDAVCDGAVAGQAGITVTTAGGSQQPAPLTAFDFEAVTGSTVPDTTGTIDGVNHGATVAAGYHGQGLSFDGTDHVDLGQNLDFEKDQAFTVSARVRPDAVNGKHVIVSKMTHGGNYRGWMLWISGGYPGFILRHDWAEGTNRDLIAVKADMPVTSGQWVHLAVAYDGSGKASGVVWYINGIRRDSQVSWDQLTGSTLTDAPTNIGARDGGQNGFMGIIDDLRIDDRLLTECELGALLNRPSP